MIMPRIRSIKPDYWTDEKIVEVAMPVRLFFIGTWNFADDFGNLARSPQKLKMQIFPADVIDVEPLIVSLITHGLLTEYSVNGQRFLHINGFKKHQRINRPSKDGLVPRFEARDGDALTEHSVSKRAPKKRAKKIAASADEKTETLSEPQSAATHSDAGNCDASLTEHSLTEKEKEKEVNLKPKPSGKEGGGGTATRTRAEPDSGPPPPACPPNPSAVITRIMRDHGIAKASPSNVRIVALADAGVTPERVIEACDEAHATHPDESISANYVCTILEAWQRNGHGAQVVQTSRNGNGSPPTLTPYQRDRAAQSAIAAAIYADLDEANGHTVDVQATEIRDARKIKNS
jgi:hypothetical protein